MSNKYYAVAKGKKVGIFKTWNECQTSIKGYKGAIFKSFTSFKEAQDFIQNNSVADEINRTTGIDETLLKDIDEGIVSVFVDGSYNKQTKQIGFGILIIPHLDESKWIKISNQLSKDELIKYGKHLNISGEIIGTLVAIKSCLDNGINNIKIYYDYLGIEMWAINKWDASTEISIMYKEVLKNLKSKYQFNLNFQKVRAHAGVKYNEIVDSLAKKSVGLQ